MWFRCNSPQHNSPMKWTISFIYLFILLMPKGLTATDVGNFSCPTDWVGDGNSCYFISDHLTTWDVARSFCRQIGSVLVAINNESRQQELDRHLPVSDWILKGVWLGLNDLRSPGVFEWVDGTAINYTNWMDEMPDWNPENATGSCVTLDIETLKWKIKNCTDEQGFICGPYNQTLLLPTDNHCDEPEMKSFLGSCYWTIPGATGWLGADKWCGTEGGRLVTISNSLENIFLYEFVQSVQRSHWIGCRVDANESFVWMNEKTGNYSNWDGTPSTSANMCAVMERHGKWMMQPCQAQIPDAICERSHFNFTHNTTSKDNKEVEISDDCEVGWKRIGQNCYMVVGDPLTWEGARNQCVSLGGELVHLTTHEDEESVLNLIADAVNNSSNPLSSNLTNLWLGLFNTSTQTGLNWSDGKPTIYTNWKSSSPVNISSPDELLCGTFEVTSGQWINALCSSLFPFLCQIEVRIRPSNNSSCEGMTCQSAPTPNANTPNFTTPINADERAINDLCPHLWTNFGDRCYVFLALPNNRIDWQSAANNCHSLGGDLVSIQSEAEYMFILKQMELQNVTRVWIGLKNEAGQLQYTDNSPVIYTDWSTVEGDFALKTGCVKIETTAVSGKWVTTDCRLSMAYVCQKFQSEKTVTTATTFTPEEQTVFEPEIVTDPSIIFTTDDNTDFDNNVEQTTAQPDTDININIYVEPSNSTITDPQPHQETYIPNESATPEINDDIATNNAQLVTVQCNTSTTEMTGGAIAGIVLSCILGTSFLVALALYLHQRRLAGQYVGGKFSFDNALYNPHGDHIQLDTNMPNR